MSTSTLSTIEEDERSNFFRLSLLFCRVGNNTLRKYFKSKWPGVLYQETGLLGTAWSNIFADGNQLITSSRYLNLNSPELVKVRSGNTNDWDFALLTTVLLYSVNQRFAPRRSVNRDKIQALKNIRNEFVAHTNDARLENSIFESHWQDACDLFVYFGATQEEFDAVTKDIQRPFEEIVLILKKWTQREEEIWDILVKQVICVAHQYNHVIQTLEGMRKESKHGQDKIQNELIKHRKEMKEMKDAILSVVLHQKGPSENVLPYIYRYHPDELKRVIQSYGLEVGALRLGCISITVRCSSLQSLERFWKDYKSGVLNKALEKSLATKDVLEKFHLSEIKLETFISEDMYLECRRILEERAEKVRSEDEPNLSETKSREDTSNKASDVRDNYQSDDLSLVRSGRIQDGSRSRDESNLTVMRAEGGEGRGTESGDLVLNKGRDATSCDLYTLVLTGLDEMALQGDNDEIHSAGLLSVQPCENLPSESESSDESDEVTASMKELDNCSSERGIYITVRCPNLQSLENIWKDYKSGLLNNKIEKCLMTEEVQRRYQLKEKTLYTVISENQYHECRRILEKKDLNEEDVVSLFVLDRTKASLGCSDVNDELHDPEGILSAPSSPTGHGLKDDANSKSTDSSSGTVHSTVKEVDSMDEVAEEAESPDEEDISFQTHDRSDEETKEAIKEPRPGSTALLPYKEREWERGKRESSVTVKMFQRLPLQESGINLTVPLDKKYTVITADGSKIRETVRRQKDIEEMGNNAMSSVFLRCLTNRSRDRPDAANIVQELKSLRNVTDESFHRSSELQAGSSCSAGRERPTSADTSKQPNSDIPKVDFIKVPKQPRHDFQFKTLFLGDTGVGKSCLLQRLKNPAIEFDLAVSKVAIDTDWGYFRYDSKHVNMQITDTVGQDVYFSIQPLLFRGVHGIFLVFDVTRKETFLRLNRWISLARTYGSDSHVQILLVGNKVDVNDERQVSQFSARDFATDNGFPYLETSVKDEYSLMNMYKKMTQMLILFNQ